MYKAGFWFLLIICAVKSDDENQCEDNFVDMKNKPINITSHCDKNNCILKCCGAGEIFNVDGICSSITTMNVNYANINYSAVNVYSRNENTLKLLTKTIDPTFLFVQNKKLASLNCSFDYVNTTFNIIDDGSLLVEGAQKSQDTVVVAVSYCIEFQVTASSGKAETALIFRISNVWPMSTQISIIFTKIGFLTTCFFLLLVLIVYCLLRELRNLQGYVVMAYTATLFTTYLLQSVLLFNATTMDRLFYKIISPCLYFFWLSSFCWLTVFCYDARSRLSKCMPCQLSRRKTLQKFTRYGLVGSGLPLFLAILFVILDNVELGSSFLKPSFEKMFNGGIELHYYLNIPIGIATAVNVFMFIMTAHYICKTSRTVANLEDSKCMKNKRRFKECVKLGLLMGVSWILTLLDWNNYDNVWQYMILNFLSLFIGIPIFFIFLFKKKILIRLCKRFNINNDYDKNLNSTQQTSSSRTREPAVAEKSAI